MQNEPINTGPIQQFLKQVKGADAGRAKDVTLDIQQAKSLAFTLGIGYNDTTKMKYKSWVPRPFFDEIIKWV